MRLACLFTVVLAPLCANAQEVQKPLRKFVVADIETRVPIRDVVVSTGDGYRDTTNYRGICYIPEAFDTLTIAKANYLTERLVPKEISDSTFLIPNHKRISEVTVWGRDGTKGMLFDFSKAIQEGMAANQAEKAPISIGFDFAKMLDKRYRKDQKNLRKTLRQFEKMDKLDDDPIVNAYKRELEEKRLAKERALKAKELRENQLRKQQQTMEEKRQQTQEESTQETTQP